MAATVPRRRARSTRGPLLVALILALLVHVPVGLWFIQATWLKEVPEPERRPTSVRFMKIEEKEEEPEENAEEEEPTGQIVEIAPPENQERPEEAEYRAEYNSTVEEETVDPRYRIDREVTAETYSADDAYEEAVEQPMDVPNPQVGATAGRPAVFRNGNFSLFPDRQSEWNVADESGMTAPRASTSALDRYTGSPSNDLIEEAMAERTRLNATEDMYAAFWNRLKQLVSFYADQTLTNARPRTALTKARYDVHLKGLISPDGSLHAIKVEGSCGIPEFDEALVEAFELAAPFPDPPEGAVAADGFIHMDDFLFSIQITAARAEMSGIDPRSMIQFPGLQTVPR